MKKHEHYHAHKGEQGHAHEHDPKVPHHHGSPFRKVVHIGEDLTEKLQASIDKVKESFREGGIKDGD